MFLSPNYTETNFEAIASFIHDNSFATICGNGDKFIEATQVPLLLEKTEDSRYYLVGHIAKNTEHYRAFVKHKEILVLFTGPHCYISPRWYGNPQQAGTWNYMTVQIKGVLNFYEEDGTFTAIKKLTDKYEGKDSEASFSLLNNEYIKQNIKAIAGFEIKITEINCTFKLSQNKDNAIRQSVINALLQTGEPQSIMVAEEMEKRLHK